MKKSIAMIGLAAAMLVLAACGSKAGTSLPAVDAAQVQETGNSESSAQAVYQSLVGDYQDSVSQRANMTTWLTNGGLAIRVSWSSSAFQNNEWNMTAVLTADNKLEYTNCSQFEITYHDNDTHDSKEIYSNQKGYFTIEGNKLIWNGASDEICQACVFERMPEFAGA